MDVLSVLHSAGQTLLVLRGPEPYLAALPRVHSDGIVDTILLDTGELQLDDIPGLIGALQDPTVAAIADGVWDELLTGALHNIATSAGRRLRTLQDFGVYEGGAVWIDTVNGAAGTTDFENGTVNNPVSNITDARTIADSVMLKIFHVLPGSAITLAAAFNDFEFIGFDYTMALGSQSVNKTKIEGSSSISGTFSGLPRFVFSSIGNITAPVADMHVCGLT